MISGGRLPDAPKAGDRPAFGTHDHTLHEKFLESFAAMRSAAEKTIASEKLERKNKNHKY